MLWKTYNRHGADINCPISVSYKVEAALSDSGHLAVDLTGDWPQKAFFHVIPLADSGLHLTTHHSTSRRWIDTLGEESVAFLRSKLHVCLATHTKCHLPQPTNASRYPTRLLNVRDQYPKITLEDTNEETQGAYFTLSHCWGGLQPIMFARKSEQSLRNGIYFRDLPKTFREAIDLCRVLDIAYLWIDSMCIFQDDLKDWHAEAASMCQVYSAALCNIAATSAQDSSIGLRFEYDTKMSRPFRLFAPEQFWLSSKKQTSIEYLIIPLHSFMIDVEFAPLNNRAWVFQERLLSRRILHVTASGVYWECLSNTSSVLYPERLPGWSMSAIYEVRAQFSLLQATTCDNPSVTRTSDNEIYHVCNTLCKDYSRLAMTREEDKLVAIQAIAQQLSQVNGDRLVCGLWEQHLMPQLLWFHDGNSIQKPFPLRWRAPSWSWASQNRHIRHAAHLSCGYGQARATVDNIDMDTHLSGQLRDASLTLCGKVVEATLDLPIIHRDCTTGDLQCGDETLRVERTYFDRIPGDTTIASYHDQVLCIGVYEDRCIQKRLTRNWELGVLILRQCRWDPPRYERVGIFLLEGREVDFYTAHETEDKRSVTII
ncbi:Nn.00g003290.m01.CDS01 [Neocucurbitaria sp. VM-36]